MNIVIIGAGLAGASAATELRSQGHSGDITLIGDEPHPPYERPPLSKGLLLGSADPDSVFVHPTQWYDDHDVELITGSPVNELDLDTGHVVLGGDSSPTTGSSSPPAPSPAACPWPTSPGPTWSTSAPSMTRSP